MFGGGGNPRKMQQMMEQMGIDLEELDADTVTITLADGTTLAFDDPEVTRMDARGQQTYQIVGDATEAAATEDTSDEDDEIPQGDVDIVVQRTGASESAAREALEATDGDLAAAVERLE
ncbi:MAG: nascent polypeptide-associated complex protein [Halobacteriaceae archaeon]